MSNTNISGKRFDFMLHEYYILSTCDVHPFDLATICHPPYPCEYMMAELSQRDLPSWLHSTFQGDGKTDTEYLGQMLS